VAGRVLLLVVLLAALAAAVYAAAIPGYVEAWRVSTSSTVVDMDMGDYIAVVAGSTLYVVGPDGSQDSFTLSSTPVAVAAYGSYVAVASSSGVTLYFYNGTSRSSFPVTGVRDVELTSTLIIVGGDEGVKAFLYDGTEEWSVNSTGSVDVVAAGAALFAANTAVYKLSLDGAIAWNVSLGAAVTYLYPAGVDRVVAAAGGSVFLVEGGGVTWRKDFAETVGAVAVCGDTVVVFTGGQVYGLSLATGEEKWSGEAEFAAVSAVCGEDGLYVAGGTRVVKYVKVSGVSVTSEPSGARVYIDGVEKGRTPLTVSIAPGKHRIKLVYKDYVIEDVFSLEPGETRDLHYVFNGTLVVVTIPPKSRVRLNGHCIGFTPVKREIRPGTYELLVVNGPLSYRRNITIKPGRLLNLTIVFNGTLIVETRPEGLLVRIDGREAGRTPLRVALKPGPHHVAIIFKNRTIIRTFSLEAGEYKRIFIQFNSTLLIDVKPRDAQVYLDGKELEKAYGVYKVDPGEHVVLAYCGGHEYRRILYIEAGEDARVRVLFNFTLHATSVPPGVDVYVNGTKRGATPLSVVLPAGNYVVEFRYANESVTRTVSMDRCGDKSLIVVFNSTLVVETFPRGLPVYVDGNEVGTSPITVNVPVGEHTVRARWIVVEKTERVNAGPGVVKVKIEFWEPIMMLAVVAGLIALLGAYILLARGGGRRARYASYTPRREYREAEPRRRGRRARTVEDREWREDYSEEWDDW